MAVVLVCGGAKVTAINPRGFRGVPYLEQSGWENRRACRNNFVEAGSNKENGTNGDQGNSFCG